VFKKSPSNASGIGVGGKPKISPDLYSMDLGTMGIPREISHLRSNANFLFSSDNQVGPGDYDVKNQMTQKSSPKIGFSPMIQSVQGTFKSNEKKIIDGYLSTIKDQNEHLKRRVNKDPNYKIESFTDKERKKQSF